MAFVVPVYARRIAGWRVSSGMQTDFVPDALAQALYERQPVAHALTHPFVLPHNKKAQPKRAALLIADAAAVK